MRPASDVRGGCGVGGHGWSLPLLEGRPEETMIPTGGGGSTATKRQSKPQRGPNETRFARGASVHGTLVGGWRAQRSWAIARIGKGNDQVGWSSEPPCSINKEKLVANCRPPPWREWQSPRLVDYEHFFREVAARHGPFLAVEVRTVSLPLTEFEWHSAIHRAASRRPITAANASCSAVRFEAATPSHSALCRTRSRDRMRSSRRP